jgi:hypothetical protein
MNGEGQFILSREIIVLCEGAADQNFLKKLMENRGGFPEVDFLPATQDHAGRSGFGRGLTAIAGMGLPFTKLRAVLIVADSHTNPAATFAHVCAQIAGAAFPVPNALMHTAPGADGKPSVTVMLLPEENTPGALETLFARQMASERDWIAECVDAFLKCGESESYALEPEKLAKARFGAMVAATCQNDPSRAASVALRTPPVFDIGGAAFNDVERRLRDFFAGIGL